MVTLIEEKMGRGRISVVDDEIWDLVKQKLQEGTSLIHFITDSRDYLHEAWKRFGDALCYGLHWQQISDTKNKMCSRSTTMQTSVVNFAILMQCDEVYCCKCSSLTDSILSRKREM